MPLNWVRAACGPMLLHVRVPRLETPAGTAVGSAQIAVCWAAICSSICCVSGVRGPISAAMASARIEALSRESGSDALALGSRSAVMSGKPSAPAATAALGAIHSHLFLPTLGSPNAERLQEVPMIQRTVNVLV